MRWWMWVLVVVVIVCLAGTAYAYLGPKNPNVGDRSKLTARFSVADQHAIETVHVTRAQLAEATCGDAPHCWVAVNGVVYDLAGLEQWKSGRHHGLKAGTDATEGFVKSPHPAAKIEGVPVVGRLVE